MILAAWETLMEGVPVTAMTEDKRSTVREAAWRSFLASFRPKRER